MRIVRVLAVTIGWLVGAISSWWLVVWLVIERDVGSERFFWAPERLLAYAAFLAAPAVTFLPLARLVHVPFLEIEAIAGWSTTLFVWAFIDPSALRDGVALVLLLLPLVVAVASLATLISAAIRARLRWLGEWDPLVARRQGYVLALVLVGCLLLNALEALTAINVGLLALIGLLVELLAATWFAPVRTTGENRGAVGDRRRWDEHGRGAAGPR